MDKDIENNSTDKETLKDKILKLSLKKGDVLIFRIGKSKQMPNVNIMKAIDKYVRKFGAITIFVEHGIDVENFNEEQMEKMGWVRKEKVRSYI